MLRNLLTSLVEHEAIETTHARCKVLKREVDKLITLGKKGTLHARRLAARTLFTPESVQKLFDELGPRFAERPGGYCRIIQRGPRRGDSAPMSIIELLSEDEPYEPRPKLRAAAAPEPSPEPAEEPAAEEPAAEEPAAEEPAAEEPAAEEPAAEEPAADEPTEE